MTTMTDSEALAVLDEVSEYIAERADVKDGDYGQPEPNTEMTLHVELRQARAHIAEALEDAARYRKARELATGFHGTGFSEIAVTLDWPSGTYHRTGDYFDAAIDAAMKDDHA